LLFSAYTEIGFYDLELGYVYETDFGNTPEVA